MKQTENGNKPTDTEAHKPIAFFFFGTVTNSSFQISF
jgi:hypothetical protein